MTWSYCNSGFVVMGRVIEKLTGGTWDAALRERIFTPLGLQHTVTLPEDALLYRAAVGHVAEGDGRAVPRTGVAAAALARTGRADRSTPADVLAFARMHLAGGVAADGTQRAQRGERRSDMTAKHADLPDKYTLGDSWGLGWIRFDWDGHRLIGHDGNTIGQAAFLRLLPDQGLAVTLLTNGGNTRDLYEDLYREIFAELAGVAMPNRSRRRPTSRQSTSASTSAPTSEPARAWRCSPATTAPRLRVTITGPIAELVPDPVEEYDLVAGRRVRRPVRGARAECVDLDAGDLLRPGDRRAVRALRRAGNSEGRLTCRWPNPPTACCQACSPTSRRWSRASRRRTTSRLWRRALKSSRGSARRALGAEPERFVLEGRTHLRWRFGPGASRVLVLGHHDTVWPIGSLATHPFSCIDGVLRGPGCFDMKAGVVMAFHAIAALPDRDGVTLLVTGDEEIGSPTSRSLIEDEARGCVAALVLEASADGGALKTERKGVSLYEVRVRGRAAHAGLEPERGVNATIELAHQVLAIAAWPTPQQGTTVTPTKLAAGTTSNTVPAARHARRRRTRATPRPSNSASTPRCTRWHRCSTVRASRSAAARTARRSIATRRPTCSTAPPSWPSQLGLPPLLAASVGGASDGNFTAGVGTPTLDGMGAVGGGAHADDEHVLVAELPSRTALLTAADRRPAGPGGHVPADQR